MSGRLGHPDAPEFDRFDGPDPCRYCGGDPTGTPCCDDEVRIRRGDPLCECPERARLIHRRTCPLMRDPKVAERDAFARIGGGR